LFPVAALVFACGTAFAEDYDYTFGADARAFAMGGAGLATTRNQPNNERRFNPASLAFTPKGFAIYSPSFSFRADGAISTTSAYSYLFSGAELSETTDLVRRFGEEDSVFGFNSNIGFRVGSFELLVQGVAKARLLPNEALANWSRAGANLSNVPRERPGRRSGGGLPDAPVHRLRDQVADRLSKQRYRRRRRRRHGKPPGIRKCGRSARPRPANVLHALLPQPDGGAGQH
jgi:hypothetical protein